MNLFLSGSLGQLTYTLSCIHFYGMFIEHTIYTQSVANVQEKNILCTQFLARETYPRSIGEDRPNPCT